MLAVFSLNNTKIISAFVSGFIPINFGLFASHPASFPPHTHWLKILIWVTSLLSPLEVPGDLEGAEGRVVGLFVTMNHCGNVVFCWGEGGWRALRESERSAQQPRPLWPLEPRIYFRRPHLQQSASLMNSVCLARTSRRWNSQGHGEIRESPQIAAKKFSPGECVWCECRSGLSFIPNIIPKHFSSKHREQRGALNTCRHLSRPDMFLPSFLQYIFVCLIETLQHVQILIAINRFGQLKWVRLVCESNGNAVYVVQVRTRGFFF